MTLDVDLGLGETLVEALILLVKEPLHCVQQQLGLWIYGAESLLVTSVVMVGWER